MVYIITALISYLIGTIPFALILVKNVIGADVLSEGTGNVGAMNSYDITGEKWIGITVFILDMLKGAVAVLIGYIIGSGSFITVSLAGIFVIFGHNFNIFLKFKGGRGLSSGVGIFLMINPLPIIHWGLMWLAGYYAIKKNVHIANAVGTVGMPVLILSSPDKLIGIFEIIDFEKIIYFKLYCLVLAALVLIRHIKPLKDILLKKT